MAEQERPSQSIALEPSEHAIANINVAWDEELFHIMLQSGPSGRLYAISPKHAKRFLLLLQREIEKYEKKFGMLTTELPEIKTGTGPKGLGFDMEK